MNKRQFLKGMMGMSMATPLFVNLQKWTEGIAHLSAAEAAKDEEFWHRIRSTYRLKSDYINLENGYYCIIPQETLEHYIQHIRHINYQGFLLYANRACREQRLHGNKNGRPDQRQSR